MFVLIWLMCPCTVRSPRRCSARHCAANRGKLVPNASARMIGAIDIPKGRGPRRCLLAASTGVLRRASLQTSNYSATKIPAAVRLQITMRSPSGLFRQLGAGGLCPHLGRVPIRPVLVALSGELLVFAVRGFGATQRAGQIRHRGKSRGRRIDPTGQPRGNLLEQPAVAIRLAERGERTVAAILRVRTADADAPEQIRLGRARVT